MKKIILCTLFFIFAFGFVPTSAVTIPADIQANLDIINNHVFDDDQLSYQNLDTAGVTIPSDLSNCSFILTRDVFLGNSSTDISLSNSGSIAIVSLLDLYIVGEDNSYSVTIPSLNTIYLRYGSNYFLTFNRDNNSLSTSDAYMVNSYTFNNYKQYNGYSITGSLSDVISKLKRLVNNANIYVNGVLWSSPLSSYTIETEIELPLNIIAVDSSFNFFNGGYGISWKQGPYNWTQTGPLENVTRTLVWTVSYPSVSYVQSLYNQSFVDTSPLDVVRNAFNTVFNEGTSIYDIPEQFRATTNFFINIDSPELGSSYHTSYDSTTQQWSLTQSEYSYSVVNGYEFNTGFFQQLYQLYGDPDLFSIALCYITPVRVSMYAVDDIQGIIYNPLSIYWLDLKQSNGTVLEYRNFGSQTTVTDDNITDDTTSNDSVTGGDSPFVNPSEEQLNTNYNNSIQDSYNHTVNNYYNYNEINTDLLDYYLSFRDGGTEEDVQDAFGYLNATISSLSNVPVVLHNLFYNFFPLPVLRLMQALFIVFMVFMIIIIIKHLFR